MARSIWAERIHAICKPQSRLSVSEWAGRFRNIAMGTSPEPGLWSNERTPYLVEPMDAFSDVNVQTVVCMMSSQVGKTELVLNVIGYYADQDPSPQLVVQPTDAMMEAFSKERVVPMFRESVGLRGKLKEEVQAKRGKTVNTIRIKHYPGGYLAFASSNTASGLASRPIRIALFDEVDRYGNTREGDPIKLGIQRTANFYNRKIGIVSTPTIKGQSKIEWWWMQSDQRRFWVPCCHCGHFQTLDWSNLKWDREECDETIHKPETAAYVCPNCGGIIRERQRNEMLTAGEWRPGKPGARHRGYHISAMYSPWVNFAELAEEWVSVVKNSDKEGLMEFINLKLGEPFEYYKMNRQVERIMGLKDDRPRGLVPGEISGIVAGVDTQDNGFWYEIRAYGRGHVQTSWCIREGFIPADWNQVRAEDLHGREYPYHPAFDGLRQVLWEDEYKDASGTRHEVMMAGIDSAGHRTTEVYDFCRAHRGRVIPIRGVQRMQSGHKFFNVETYPGTNKPIPGGVRRADIHVTQYKGRLAAALDIAPSDPGAVLFHSEFPESHAMHYTAEYEDDKGVWQCVSGKDNHLWDCTVYGMCVADILGLRHRAEVKQKVRPMVRPQQHQQPRTPLW